MNTDPNPCLPDEILNQLDFSEIPDTLKVWQLSEAYCSGEPSDDRFRHMGQDMWPLIQKATQPPLRRIITWQRVTAMAACIAVILSIGITLSQQPISLVVPLGEQLTHELPDGSTIYLNSGTHVEYSKNFGTSSRELTLLEGELHLDVQPSSIPLTVESFDAKTEVLGTSFNIRAWPDEIEAATNVIVESGEVQLTPLSDLNLSVILTAGQSARIRSNGLEPLVKQMTGISTIDYPWIDGGFKFSDEPLGNVIREIERRYDVKINVEPTELESLSLPIGILKHSPESAEEIIRDVCELHCVYRAVSDGFLVTAVR